MYETFCIYSTLSYSSEWPWCGFWKVCCSLHWPHLELGTVREEPLLRPPNSNFCRFGGSEFKPATVPAKTAADSSASQQKYSGDPSQYYGNSSIEMAHVAAHFPPSEAKAMPKAACHPKAACVWVSGEHSSDRPNLPSKCGGFAVTVRRYPQFQSRNTVYTLTPCRLKRTSCKTPYLTLPVSLSLSALSMLDSSEGILYDTSCGNSVAMLWASIACVTSGLSWVLFER